MLPVRKIVFAGFFICFLWPAIGLAQTNLTAQQKADLQAELVQVEAEQKRAAQDLAAAQSKSSSLAKDIAVLGAKIKKAQLDIKAKNLLIKTLGDDISLKIAHIDELEGRIEKGKTTLALILRKTNEIDDYSLPEVILSQSDLSGFFKDIDDFQAVQEGLKNTFEQIRSDKVETTEAKDILDKRRNAEIDAKYVISQQEKNITSDQLEQKKLLSISMGNEKAYADLVAAKQARAAQIRSALFSLRDTAAIPFGQALQYANLASQKTGIRPAFLLGIFAQESSLNRETGTFGGHIGSCYLTNTKTGAGIGINSGNVIEDVMHPTRDVPPFLNITKALGLDPFTTPVSCPFTIGYGGAMGPAQFIASTWVLIQNRLANLLGISGMPNPWNPPHAFMASAMYLTDLGADAQTYTAERNAACRYYSGAACGVRSGSTSYGNSVMKNAETIQRTMIDLL